jgi:hypothetical protein
VQVIPSTIRVGKGGGGPVSSPLRSASGGSLGVCANHG